MNKKTRKDFAELLGVNLSTLWRHLNSPECQKTFVLAVSAATGIPTEQIMGKGHCPACHQAVSADSAEKRSA